MTEGEQSEAKSLADESLPGLTELLGFNERGELHEIDCGTVLEDKWELLELLGEGSFGKVYEARHVILGRRAAIKVLIGRQADPRARQRFLEEAQLLAGMQSNNLVRASDYGEGPGGVPYFVMDLVEGKSLRHWIRDGLTLEQVLMLGAHLLIGQVRPPLIAEVPEGDILQPVTGRADLGVDLQATLKLALIVAAEGAFEGEVVIVDFGRTAGREGRGGDAETQRRDGSQCKCSKHHGSFPHSAGVAAGAAPSALP